MAGDHTQIPKSILKGFCDKNKKVYAVDNSGKIKHCLISEVNAKIEYYNNFVETKILGERECKFGDIKKQIIDCVKGKTSINYNSEINEIILDFFYISMFRSEKLIQEIKENSVAMVLLDEKPQNIILSYYERCIPEVKKIFPNYHFNIMNNMSSIDFVIPQKMFFGLKKDNESMFFMPITPKIAITLNSNIEPYVKNDTIAMQLVSEDEQIDIINQLAIKREFDYNNKMVYSQKKETLERYIDFIKSYFCT